MAIQVIRHFILHLVIGTVLMDRSVMLVLAHVHGHHPLSVLIYHKALA